MTRASHCRALLAMSLLLVMAACTDRITQPGAQPEPGPTPPPTPLGVYEIQLTGFDGSGGFNASKAVAVPAGPSSALTPVNGLALEVVSSSSFTEGTRGQGGQRYISVTYRVRNSTGAPVSNVTFVPITTASTISGTPFSNLLLFNNTAASAAIAQQLVPTGAMFLHGGATMRARDIDVLQVFTEPEVAAISLPPGTTGIFPYGFVVSNPSAPGNRTLPHAADANEWSGLVTFAFRYPLQSPSAAADPFFVAFQVLAVQDTETRMTETIEESRDTSAVRRIRERAAALGATTVTVLNGSPAMDPFVTDYPGQRQICSARTAGTAAAPVTRINAPAAYMGLALYYPGESRNGCEPYFRSGTPSRPATNVGFTVRARALDRYGNQIATAVDTVQLKYVAGPPFNNASPRALVGGEAGLNISYTDYGMSQLAAQGRRYGGGRELMVAGVTRTWTAGAGTNDWYTNGNWSPAAVPMYLDTVTVPGDLAHYPLINQNTITRGLTMTAGTSVQPFVNLSAFDMTVGGDVQLGTTGTFTGTGRLLLNGTSNTIGGGVSNFDVRNLRITESGRYSVTSNINVTGGRIVVQGGRLRNERHRIRVKPN